MDDSALSEISKFHSLLEVTKRKRREDILGLTYILTSAYGKNIKVHRALVKETESLYVIDSTQKAASIHEVYTKLSRIVRVLKTLKKLDTAKSMVYTLLDKLGPVREVIAQGDGRWEG